MSAQALSPIAAKTNLAGLDLLSLQAFFVGLGEKPFRATQVIKWIHKFGIDDFSLMTDLSKALRAYLPEVACIEMPTFFKEQVSTDGTYKWLVKLEGADNLIETVYIPEEGRGTLCISSQVGCKLNCTFCSTGTQGFNRNLSTEEIIGQVWAASKRLKEVDDTQKITNIVLMGMGEPLLNYDAVLKALHIMRDELAYNLPRRRVTLSTSGLIPNIDRLQKEADVALAVSLHAPNDALRDILVPLNRKYPIAQLMDACRRYAGDKRRHKVTMEYVMLKGVNDSIKHAKELARLLKGVPCKVNLIPFNPFPGTKYLRSDSEDIIAFRYVLVDSGLVATTRRTRGADIDAACGQFRLLTNIQNISSKY